MRKLRLILCGRLLPFALILFLLLAAGVALCIYLPAALAPIAAAERILSLAAALIVALDRTPAAHKVSKLVLVITLPWMGAIVVLLFKSNARQTNFDGTMSEDPPSHFPPAAISERLSGLKGCTLESAEYFPVGSKMLPRLLQDCASAKKSIWLEYYIIAEGTFLSKLTALLEARAKDGVDVRILCDGFGSALLPKKFAKTLSARGIKFAFVRPMRFPSRHAGRRDHRKIAVIDGKIAYTGGINVADEYIGEILRFGHWKDTAVRVTGRVAEGFSKLFARTWNEEVPASPISPPEISAAKGDKAEINCAVIADSEKESELRAGVQLLLHLIGQAKRRLYINTPYLSPDTPLLSALKGAALAGVDVRLMIPHIPDKRLPFLLTRSYADELIRAGVQVREYTDGFLHAKSVLSDEISFVSSYNLDFRSLYLQAECGVCTNFSPLAGALEEDFLAAWEMGTEVKLRRPAALFGRLLRLIAPLL